MAGMTAGCPADAGDGDDTGATTADTGSSTGGATDDGGPTGDDAMDTTGGADSGNADPGNVDTTGSDDRGETAGAMETGDTAGVDTGETGADGPEAACVAYYGVYDECFPRYAGYEDCDYVFDMITIDGCADVVGDYYQCLSGLDCRTLDTKEGFPCQEEFVDVDAACDGLFGFCQSGDGDGDLEGTLCNVAISNCLDEHDYAMDCALNVDTTAVDCTCTIDGENSGMFTLQSQEAFCAGDEYAEAAVASCGWPDAAAQGIV